MPETLSSAYEEFGEYLSASLEAKTVIVYQGLVKKFIKFLENKPIDKLVLMDCVRFNNHLRSKGFAMSTVAFYMVAIRRFCQFLSLNKLLDWDYTFIPIPKYKSKSIAPIDTDEAMALIDKINVKTFKGLRDKTIISLLYSSGMRVCEICRLKPSDLRVGERVANIETAKNKQTRMIFWDERTDELLKSYLSRRNTQENYLFYSVDRAGKGKGKPLSTRAVQLIIEGLRGRKEVSTHSFRHGLILRAIRADVHPRHIQGLLGHRHLSSIQPYLDIYDKDLKKAYLSIETNLSTD